MAKKKKAAKKSVTLSPTLFKVTGADAKMKIVEKSKKMYYFTEKINSEKAEKIAIAEGADILGASPAEIKAGKPSLKYDFYCIYDASLELSFLRIRPQEISVNEQVKGALVGKEVLIPKKGKDVPGPSIKIDIVELFEIKRTDGMVLDGATGGPAKALESVLKGPGKKTATAAWINKAPIATGKFNSLEKVVKAVAAMAGQKPSDAKRVSSHFLTFTKLEGYLIPVYYVTLTAGAKKQIIKVNALNSAVSVKV
ncbi:hypothetical protein EU527_15785 [Candidatus Thorarchaeota archaeon]|nr:MAG: hypothetical protein EU527_15785 [Candidatus Thorarchaeota archaeon]